MDQEILGDHGGRWAGRERESQILDRVLDRLGSGVGAVIEVTGEPGIGKTRLISELASRARGRDMQVLIGKASSARRHISGTVLADVLADASDHGMLDGAEPQVLYKPDFGHPSILHLTTPGAVARSSAGQITPDQVGQWLRGQLDELAGCGLVMALDDLHWADEFSVDVLAQLVRRPPRGPVLLVLAYRQRQASPQLRAVTAGGWLSPTPVWMRLGPLSEREAGGLIGPHGDRAWRQAVYRQSGGNPFYLGVLARSSPERQALLASAPTGLGEFPPAVAAALLAELVALSPAAQEAARAASVSYEPFCLACVMAAGGLDEADAFSGLREMADHDLIRPVIGDNFVFRHELIRAAIYDSTNPVWRIAAHARAAMALEQLGAPVTTRAYHIKHSASVGDLCAVGLLEAAARAVCDHAPAVAADWLTAALRLLPDTPDAEPTRAGLMVRLARARGAAGQVRECHDMLQDALRLLPRDGSTRRAAAVCLCAVTGRLLGRRPESQALLQAEIADLPDASTAAAAALKLELAASTLGDGDIEGGRRWAKQALSLAALWPTRAMQAAAHGVLAAAAASTCDIESASAHLKRACPLLDGLLDSELAAYLNAATWVARSELFMQRPQDGLRHADRALMLAHDRNQRLVLPELLAVKVLTLRELGRLPEAAACADEAINLALQSGCEEQHAAAQLMRCWTATWMGDSRAAKAAAAAASPKPFCCETTLPARRILAEARLAAGDITGCLDLVEAEGGPGLPAVPAWARTGWYEMLTRAAIAVGNLDAATDWVRYAQTSAGRWGLPSHAGTALLAQAELHLAHADSGSHQLATAAHRALSTAGLHFDAIRARLLAAVAMPAPDSTGQAAEELAAAQSAFSACGATRFARLAMTAVRGPAAWPHTPAEGRPHNGLAVLTHRERQVAALVSQGLSNRVVSQSLRISEKTVEKHLASTFAKLGVASRNHLTAIVARAEPAGPS